MSFLSRLSNAPPEATVDRIVRNLACIFNSRKQFGSVIPSFGLGDYEATWNTPTLLDTLMAEIVAAVREFEPAISDPSVELKGRDRQLWVRFELSGLVEDQPMSFYIDIDSKYRHVVVSPAP